MSSEPRPMIGLNLSSDQERQASAYDGSISHSTGTPPMSSETIPEWARLPNWKTGKSVIDRFMALNMPEPNSGCWLWLGNVERPEKPYGRMDVAGITYLAHRLSYLMFVGPLLDGQVVCHKCDNPSCVNPKHLFAGTLLENAQDRNAKNRQAIGSSVGTSRLSVHQAAAIKSAPGSSRAIAKRFGVDCTVVSRIKSGKTWAAAIRSLGEKT